MVRDRIESLEANRSWGRGGTWMGLAEYRSLRRCGWLSRGIPGPVGRPPSGGSADRVERGWLPRTTPRGPTADPTLNRSGPPTGLLPPNPLALDRLLVAGLRVCPHRITRQSTRLTP